jgi:transcriptional regulator with GAF, ATPase, and Fis domain
VSAPDATAPSPALQLGWHDAIAAFKRQLLAQALVGAGGNRTRAARTLGLQRTYFLRLIRELGIAVPR